MSSQSKAQKRKSKKKYYINSSKKTKSFCLESGMKGFLITCNDEYRSVKEAYNLLNAFADEIYGPENEQTTNNTEDSYEDLEEQFEKEVAAIKSKSRSRFQQVSTKVKGTLFIKTTIPDPASLVKKIFETVITSGERRTRFISRFKPVTATCKVYEEDIRKAVQEALLQLSEEERERELKYKVECKIRHNDKITSSHLLLYSRDAVKISAPKWSESILNPNRMIFFDVLCNVCCVGILDKYEEYKKYNLSNVVQFDDPSSKVISESVSLSESNNANKNTSEILSENAGVEPEQPASSDSSKNRCDNEFADGNKITSELLSESASVKPSEHASSDNSKNTCESESTHSVKNANNKLLSENASPKPSELASSDSSKNACENNT